MTDPAASTGIYLGDVDSAKTRLKEERKAFRRDKPFGFWARPVETTDGTLDLFRWEAGIPGKKDGLWDGGCYHLTIQFTAEYPSRPPKCQFKPVLFHPNIYPSGTVCLSILNEEKHWRASMSIKHILMAIQDLLENPNVNDPAQKEPLDLYCKDRDAYAKRVREEAKLQPCQN